MMQSSGLSTGLASKHRPCKAISGVRAPLPHHPQLIRSARHWPHARQHIERAHPFRPAASTAASAPSASSSCGPADELQQPLRTGSRALSIVLGAFAALWSTLAGALRNAAAQVRSQDAGVVNAGIRQSVRHMHMLGVIAPFAAASSGANTFLLLTKAMAKFIKIYLLLLFLRVLLSWFPAFNWERQPWLALRQMTDPYLNLYRGLVPPLLGTIDFTPLLGFFILQYLSGVLESGASEDELDEWW